MLYKSNKYLNNVLSSYMAKKLDSQTGVSVMSANAPSSNGKSKKHNFAPSYKFLDNESS